MRVCWWVLAGCSAVEADWPEEPPATDVAVVTSVVDDPISDPVSHALPALCAVPGQLGGHLVHAVDGRFDYDPPGLLVASVAGGVDVAQQRFAWSTRFHDDHPRQREEVEGSWTLVPDGVRLDYVVTTYLHGLPVTEGRVDTWQDCALTRDADGRQHLGRFTDGRYQFQEERVDGEGRLAWFDGVEDAAGWSMVRDDPVDGGRLLEVLKGTVDGERTYTAALVAAAGGREVYDHESLDGARRIEVTVDGDVCVLGDWASLDVDADGVGGGYASHCR
jgi:hypothetical protein